jgi:hypothetical protein
MQKKKNPLSNQTKSNLLKDLLKVVDKNSHPKEKKKKYPRGNIFFTPHARLWE